MCEQNHTYLDTLAQLSTTTLQPQENKGIQKKVDSKQTLQKRARAKVLTNTVLYQLIDLDSPLVSSYWNTYHCNNILMQEDDKITGKFCNNRWCLVCNRIRTAKLINGYKEPLSRMKEPHFVTLTIPNVKGKYLKSTIEDMLKTLTRIRKNIKKTYGIKLTGIRKVECTYNAERNDYHPHYHFLIETKEASDKLVDMWLQQYPDAERSAQDVRKAKDTDLVEIFKYFTKVVNKDKFHPKNMDIIFRAMKGKRVFQPMGIKKDVDENIDELHSQKIDFKVPNTEIWGWEQGSYDWTTSDGELLTEYEPSLEFIEYINKLNQNKITDYDGYKDQAKENRKIEYQNNINGQEYT